MPPPNRSKVPIGTVLEGKFRVTREIGRGGMAAVYEAENIDIGKRVAVKVLAAELITSRVVRERFIREARASAAIRSPYICDVYDSGMYDERPFLVMELLEGESLYDMMTRVRRIPVDTTLRVAQNSARGLQKAHEASVIHRDLKPENIFLTKNEEGEMVAKILDFGLAKFYEPTTADAETVRLTREGALFGTPAYMSPEQAKGQGEVDHRCDLWALGCIVYECLTGTTVWNVDQGVAMILAQIAGAPIPRPSRLRPDLPRSFDLWFAKALERDANKRFQTAKELADALSDALAPGRPPAPRASPMPSEEEGQVVDDLISTGDLSPAGLTGQSPVPQIPSPSVPPSLDLSPPSGGAQPAQKSGVGRALAALAGVAALVLGGYAVWFYVLHPPPPSGGAQPVTDAAVKLAETPDAAPPPRQLKPKETLPYALSIAKGQEFVTKGKPDSAIAMFREAFNAGGPAPARSMLNQAATAFEGSNEPCKVTALGRPRPYEVVTPTSRPTIALSDVGLVSTWVDNHEDERKRQAFTAVLDDALRRVTDAVGITPEAQSVRHPQLVSAGHQLALIYWDGAGSEPGVYVRMLDQDGRIAKGQRRISEVKRHDFYPSLARTSDGTYWAVWEEETAPGSEDLVARHLNADLEPLGRSIRLTAYAGTRGLKTAAGKPDVALAHGHLNVAFALERRRKHQIMRLRVALNDPALSSGVPETDDKKLKKKDRFVGSVVAVSPSEGKNAQPRMACTADGCYVVWDNENGGAFAAYLEKDKGEPLWHREFASKGSRPAVAASAAQAMVAWYEGGKVKIATINRDKLNGVSVVGRVSGFQPYPALVVGSEPGQWYLSWRDYEAGNLEAFIVRAQCK